MATFAQRVIATLTESERSIFRRARWVERLKSLWAPPTILAVATLVYTVSVETDPCLAPRLKPVMQAFGIAMALYWAVLVAMGFLAPAWNQIRKARIQADDTLVEFWKLGNQGQSKLNDRQREELLGAGQLVLRRFAGDAPALEAATAKLRKSTHDLLAPHRGGAWDNWGRGLAFWVLVIVIVRSCIAEPFKIPSGSMLPTLEIGDQIFVNKFIYGVRLPFLNYVPFQLVRSPRRGDVIVFNNPTMPEADYIKRIVGVAGDRIDFSLEGVTVNGSLFPRKLLSSQAGSWESRVPMTESASQMLARWFSNDWQFEGGDSLWSETIDGTPHAILEDPLRARAAVMPSLGATSVVVPPGNVFVMGDNRNRSDDSRFGLGDRTGDFRFVPLGNIKGKATIIWLALGHGGIGARVFGGTGLRYDRFFSSVTMCGTSSP